MNILISGASGFIATHLIAALKPQHRLIALTRSTEKIARRAPDLDVRRADFAQITDPADWLPLLEGVDAVINCVGIIAETSKGDFQRVHSAVPKALFKAAEMAGVSKVIQISALGADRDATSRYHLSKREADDCLRSLDLDWFVLRPSIVYGPGAQSMALFHALAALPIAGVLDQGRQLLQPVQIGDLVAAVQACLEPGVSARRTIDVVGPEPIFYRDLIGLLRTRLGKAEARFISIRSQIALKFGFFGKLLAIPALSEEGIRMLLRGNAADAHDLAELIGYQPSSLQENLGEYPANQAERWHAGLYFLKPLLRVSIALVWILSGVVSAFYFPPAQSYAWLAELGINGPWAPLSLYGLAAMDGLLGLALLIGYRIGLVIYLQLFAMLAYMGVIGIGLPEFWLHPFGPLIKNFPILVASMILLVLEGEKP